MLCEKCNKQEATVHVTEVVAEASDEMKKHDFCEACFSQTELARKLSGKILGPATAPGATAQIFSPDNEPSS
jgi:protein-arginine kinase activator protein McsA